MCDKAKKVIYWLSLIGPVIDVLIGTWKGLVSAYEQAKSDRIAEETKKLYQEQLEKFRKDNE